MQYVFDISDLLTYEEWEELETRAADISNRQHCGVYFALVDDFTDYGDGSVYEVTYQLYHGSELGFGKDRDGIIVLLSMEERDYAMFVYGEYAEYAFDDFGQEKLEERFLDDFGDNDWYGGISDYLDACDEFLTKAEEGKPVRSSPWPNGGRPAVGISCLMAGRDLFPPPARHEVGPSKERGRCLPDRRGAAPDTAVRPIYPYHRDAHQNRKVKRPAVKAAEAAAAAAENSEKEAAS